MKRRPNRRSPDGSGRFRCRCGRSRCIRNSAAIAAAREGVRVVLLEEDMLPGGAPLDQFVTFICGAPRVGLFQRLVGESNARHAFGDARPDFRQGRNGRKESLVASDLLSAGIDLHAGRISQYHIDVRSPCRRCNHRRRRESEPGKGGADLPGRSPAGYSCPCNHRCLQVGSGLGKGWMRDSVRPGEQKAISTKIWVLRKGMGRHNPVPGCLSVSESGKERFFRAKNSRAELWKTI